MRSSRRFTRFSDGYESDSSEAAQRVIDRLRDAGYLDRNWAFGEAHPELYDVVFALDR